MTGDKTYSLRIYLYFGSFFGDNQSIRCERWSRQQEISGILSLSLSLSLFTLLILCVSDVIHRRVLRLHWFTLRDSRYVVVLVRDIKIPVDVSLHPSRRERTVKPSADTADWCSSTKLVTRLIVLSMIERRVTNANGLFMVTFTTIPAGTRTLTPVQSSKPRLPQQLRL